MAFDGATASNRYDNQGMCGNIQYFAYLLLLSFLCWEEPVTVIPIIDLHRFIMIVSLFIIIYNVTNSLERTMKDVFGRPTKPPMIQIAVPMRAEYTMKSIYSFASCFPCTVGYPPFQCR